MVRAVIWVLIGAILGFLLMHGFLGAVLGGAIGWVIASAGSMRRRSPAAGFVEPLFAVLGAVAKADGRVSESEIAVAERWMRRFGLQEGTRKQAIAAFNQGKQPGFDVDAAMDQLHRWSGGRRDHAITMLDVVVETVLAEGHNQAKLALLARLCERLRISQMELMALMAMKGYTWSPGQAGGTGRQGAGWQGGGYVPPRRTPEGPDPYTVLGVARDADARTVKRAYRKLISEHHPDRLGDLPEAMRRRAEARASEINAAYERIKTERGF